MSCIFKELQSDTESLELDVLLRLAARRWAENADEVVGSFWQPQRLLNAEPTWVVTPFATSMPGASCSSRLAGHRIRTF